MHIFGVSESVLKSDTLSTDIRYSKIFCDSDAYERYDPDVRERGRGGVSSKRTMLDKGGGPTSNFLVERL